MIDHESIGDVALRQAAGERALHLSATTGPSVGQHHRRRCSTTIATAEFDLYPIIRPASTTAATEAPGSNVAATISRFSGSGHDRLRR